MLGVGCVADRYKLGGDEGVYLMLGGDEGLYLMLGVGCVADR